MAQDRNPTVSARVDEEKKEEYRQVCDELGINYSDPLQELVDRLTEEPLFRSFYAELIDDSRSFNQVFDEFVEEGTERDRSVLEDGFRRMRSGLREHHEPMAYEGVDRIAGEDHYMGSELEEALDNIDEQYWEITL
jgi:hypothetical protein